MSANVSDSPEDRMDVHQNAHLTPKGREAMVRAVMDEAMTKAQAARRFKTTAKTVAKWLGRFRAEGIAGLADRSSRPHSSPSQTPWATGEAVEVLRRARCTQDHIAQELGLSRATVSRILKRRGLSLLSALEPNQPRPRYERETPGRPSHHRNHPYGHQEAHDRGSPRPSAMQCPYLCVAAIASAFLKCSWRAFRSMGRRGDGRSRRRV